MKRALLGLGAVALVLVTGSSAGAAQELPKPGGHVQYCGYTVMTPCAYCVTLDRNDVACVPL